MTCSSASDRAWLEARLAKTEELIVAYEDAILALSTGAQMYSLDTGQSRQTVSKSQLSQLRDVLAMLENRRAALMNRLCGSSRVVLVPGF
jgi:hypothetical protein